MAISAMTTIGKFQKHDSKAKTPVLLRIYPYAWNVKSHDSGA